MNSLVMVDWIPTDAPAFSDEVNWDLSVEARVSNGILLLDNYLPSWRNEFTPEVMTRFELFDEHNCVLGILFGDWLDGLAYFGCEYTDAMPHNFGFNSKISCFDDDVDLGGRTFLDDITELNAEWRRRLSV